MKTQPFVPFLDFELTTDSKTRTIVKETNGIVLEGIVSEKYRIIEVLGRGGMGIVYKAEDKRLKRNVAIKFLCPELIRDQEARQRFIQEAQAAAALDHPNICTVYEVSETPDQTFIAMAYIKGQSLKDVLKSGPLNTDQALKIATQVAEGYLTSARFGQLMIFSKLWFSYNKAKQGDIYEYREENLA